jgi:hypothetical protein
MNFDALTKMDRRHAVPTCRDQHLLFIPRNSASPKDPFGQAEAPFRGTLWVGAKFWVTFTLKASIVKIQACDLFIPDTIVSGHREQP